MNAEQAMNPLYRGKLWGMKDMPALLSCRQNGIYGEKIDAQESEQK